ncbi:MAG: beta-ketoacyl synthase [Bacteroidetes bacterium]|nr:beta-ketoacyl synthase [Bacteroidota bacterium]
MNEVIVESYNIITGLGSTAATNFSMILDGNSGVKLHHRTDIDDEPVWASLIEEADLFRLTEFITEAENYTKYEKLLIASIRDAAGNTNVNLKSAETVFIFSTTKGNISLLENEAVSPSLIKRISLSHSAKVVAEYFGNTNEPVVISNACISGVVAIMVAKRLLNEGKYKNAIVCGADVISKFVYSGFKSFQALSAGRCHPFSENRDGINLGEAAATMIVSIAEKGNSIPGIRILEGAISNDSNHISGPSRTGDELSHAIATAIQLSGINQQDLGFISAHGTATMYNDEMEAKAFYSAGLHSIPVNSLKGFFGHTLGAAGIVESVISIKSLLQNMVVPTEGFTQSGVSVSIHVSDKPIKLNANYFLKTASGFGGCNAALVFSKS